ncbi:hypothetical protein VTK26DRAFT_1982 [Humicola hyalothermophila]
MKLTALLAPLALAGAAAADSAAIVAAVNAAAEGTTALGAAVSNWKGDLLGTLPIVTESTALLVTVKKGARTAEESDEMDFYGVLDVAHAVTDLTGVVNATLTALVDAKPKFDRLLMSPLIFATLELQKRATGEMSEAIVAKVPEQLQDLARDIAQPIDASFELALDEYHPFH